MGLARPEPLEDGRDMERGGESGDARWLPLDIYFVQKLEATRRGGGNEWWWDESRLLSTSDVFTDKARAPCLASGTLCSASSLGGTALSHDLYTGSGRRRRNIRTYNHHINFHR